MLIEYVYDGTCKLEQWYNALVSEEGNRDVELDWYQLIEDEGKKHLFIRYDTDPHLTYVLQQDAAFNGWKYDGELIDEDWLKYNVSKDGDITLYADLITPTKKPGIIYVCDEEPETFSIPTKLTYSGNPNKFYWYVDLNKTIELPTTKESKDGIERFTYWEYLYEDENGFVQSDFPNTITLTEDRSKITINRHLQEINTAEQKEEENLRRQYKNSLANTLRHYFLMAGADGKYRFLQHFYNIKEEDKDSLKYLDMGNFLQFSDIDYEKYIEFDDAFKISYSNDFSPLRDYSKLYNEIYFNKKYLNVVYPFVLQVENRLKYLLSITLETVCCKALGDGVYAEDVFDFKGKFPKERYYENNKRKTKNTANVIFCDFSFGGIVYGLLLNQDDFGVERRTLYKVFFDDYYKYDEVKKDLTIIHNLRNDLSHSSKVENLIVMRQLEALCKYLTMNEIEKLCEVIYEGGSEKSICNSYHIPDDFREQLMRCHRLNEGIMEHSFSSKLMKTYAETITGKILTVDILKMLKPLEDEHLSYYRGDDDNVHSIINKCIVLAHLMNFTEKNRKQMIIERLRDLDKNEELEHSLRVLREEAKSRILNRKPKEQIENNPQS